MADEDFLYDDFFSPEDAPGVQMDVEVRGKTIPFSVRRGMSLKDMQIAREQAATMIFNQKTQMPQVMKFNEGVFNVELIFRVLKGWPFKKDGEPLPITRENIGDMNPDVVQALVQSVAGSLLGRNDALAPFASPSDVAS